MVNDKYKLEINDYRGKKDTFHISKLKLRKRNYNYAPFDKIPLFDDEKGLIHKNILDTLNIDFDIKVHNYGLFRLGIVQDNDSFLRAITNKPLKKFKTDLCKDIRAYQNLERLTNIIQLFRKDTLSCKLEGQNNHRFQLIIDTTVKECKENLINYIQSDEYKDSYLLTPLIKELTSNKNESFNNTSSLNIIVFEKKENKIIIEKPLNGFHNSKEDNYILIYKKENYYETIKLKKKDTIGELYFQLMKPTKLKENMNVLIGKEYINGIIEEINDDKIKVKIINDNSEELFTLNEFEKGYIKELILENLIIERICDLTSKTNRINSSYENEFMDYNTIIKCMGDFKYSKTKNEYIDIYHKITHLEFQKGKKIICLPIRPCNSVLKRKYKANTNIPSIELKDLLKQLELIDTKVNKEDYLPYLSNNNTLSKNYYFFQNMMFLPIKASTVNKNLDFIINMNYSIQNKNTDKDILKNYITEYHNKEYKEYLSNIDYLFYLRRNKKQLNLIKDILNHDIMIDFHKREKIYKLLKKHGNKKLLPRFIEKLLIHGYDNLQNILINNFIIKDITNENENEYIFKDFQIKNKDYLFIFEDKMKESQFIRNISINPYV